MIKTDCVYYKKNKRAVCSIYNKIQCKDKDCLDYKTAEDFKMEKYAEDVNKLAGDSSFYKSCKTSCKFWDKDTNTCTALKAPFCGVEKDCSFYKEKDKYEPVIHWVEVERMIDRGGWHEVGVRYGQNGVC